MHITSNNTTVNSITADVKPKYSSKIAKLIPLFFTKPVVAVIRLEGIIGKTGSFKSGLNISLFNKLAEKVLRIRKLDAICLCINSPGGSPVQSELISNRIISIAKELNTVVYTFIEDIAASGGYWLACSGDKIFASKSSIIGSIGVISSGFGFSSAIEKLGIERRVIAEGKNKSILDPFQPIKASDVKLIKVLQKEIYNHFINTIKQRRKDRLTQSDDLIFNGEFWTGEKALSYGLIDGIDDLYSFIKRTYDNKVKIEYIDPYQSWFKKKLGIAVNCSEAVTNAFLNLLEERLLTRKFDL